MSAVSALVSHACRPGHATQATPFRVTWNDAAWVGATDGYRAALVRVTPEELAEVPARSDAPPLGEILARATKHAVLLGEIAVAHLEPLRFLPSSWTSVVAIGRDGCALSASVERGPAKKRRTISILRGAATCVGVRLPCDAVRVAPGYLLDAADLVATPIMEVWGDPHPTGGPFMFCAGGGLTVATRIALVMGVRP